jgi:hypothetical protein
MNKTRFIARIFGLFGALLLIPGFIFAASVTLEWDAVTTNTDGTAITDLKGYKIYQSTRSFMNPTVLTPQQSQSLPYVLVFETGPVVSCAVTNLQPQNTYYFRLTAIDLSGNESAFNLTYSSADIEISTYIPAGADTPMPPQIDFTACPLPSEINLATSALKISVQVTSGSHSPIRSVTIAHSAIGASSYVFSRPIMRFHREYTRSLSHRP